MFKNIGHLRGEYIANLRLEAFRKAYNRDPILLAERPKTKDGKSLDDDFIFTNKLIDMKQAYKDFDKLIREQLDSLKEEDDKYFGN